MSTRKVIILLLILLVLVAFLMKRNWERIQQSSEQETGSQSPGQG